MPVTKREHPTLAFLAGGAWCFLSAVWPFVAVRYRTTSMNPVVSLWPVAWILGFAGIPLLLWFKRKREPGLAWCFLLGNILVFAFIGGFFLWLDVVFRN